MTTINVTPADLSEIIRILKIKAYEDRERAHVLASKIERTLTHPNRAIATSFMAQADDYNKLAESLNAPLTDAAIDASAQAIHKAMGDWQNDVSDMGDYEWDKLAPGNGPWLGEGQKRFRALAKAALGEKA